MCGISGIINKSSQQGYSSKDLKAITDPIAHRGPNDVGYLFFKDNNEWLVQGDVDTPKNVYESQATYTPTMGINNAQPIEFRIALGHRRLSIIDLSDMGHLPMSYNDGRYWITFNGEIYNYKALKAELSALGHSFVSKTDTEVILASYAQWGTSCQQKFNGMWAFSIYDSFTKEIFLSRDRFGIKPLYYWQSPRQSICFGSEIKQFIFLPGWKAKLNRQRAYDYLLYNMTDHTEETMFKGVFHIPPGHCFKSSIDDIAVDAAGKLKTEKWYLPCYKSFEGSFDEAVQQFESIFKDAVKVHLVSDVVVGSALSGGLDSSAIVCEINNLLKEAGQPTAQETFSYCSSDESANEQKWVKEVIKVTNAKPNYVFLKPSDVLVKTELLIWHNDEPSQSQSLLASFKVYNTAKDNGVKVLINGQGADEYLSGYGAFNLFRRVQLLKKWQFRKLNAEISNVANSTKMSLRNGYFQVIYQLIPNFISRFFSRYTKNYQELSGVISLAHLQAKQQHPYDSIPYKSNNIFSIAHKQLLYDPLQKYLRYEDRMSMANSIESRVPFLDHRLVEFSTQLPADFLDGPGESKKMMLHGLKDILPQAILHRKDKIGFITSEESWVRREFTEEFRKMLEQSITASKGVVRVEALQYFDKVVAGTIPFSYNYWRFIQFGLWMQLFDVELQ